MKKMISLSLCLLMAFGYLQAQFNDYKYIVVPTRFARFKIENQFQTSTMAKYHIAQNGFNVIYDNAIPDDLREQRCLGLWVDLVDSSTLFVTKVQLDFKDCYGESVFVTNEGRTKIKDYKGAYATAIKQAAASLKGKEHNYVAKKEKKTSDVVEAAGSEISEPETVEKPIEKQPIPETVQTAKATVEEVLEDKVTEIEDVVEPAKEKAAMKEVTSVTPKKEVLYAQPTAEGYQLVDTTPAVRYVLEATSVDNVFLVNQEGINGVVLKKDERWFLEYKGPNGKVSQELFIKF